MSKRSTARLLFVLIVAVVASSACGSSGSDTTAAPAAAPAMTSASTAAEPSSTSSSAPSTLAPLTEEEQIEQTVLEMWAMLKRVSADPDPDHPDLEKYLAGSALEHWQSVLADWRDKGYAVRDSPENRWEHRPKFSSLSNELARVIDCSLDDGWLVSTATGELIDGDSVVREWEVFLSESSRGWVVVQLEPASSWYSGDLGCTSGW